MGPLRPSAAALSTVFISAFSQLDPFSIETILMSGWRPKRLCSVSAIMVSMIGRSVLHNAHCRGDWACEGLRGFSDHWLP